MVKYGKLLIHYYLEWILTVAAKQRFINSRVTDYRISTRG